MLPGPGRLISPGEFELVTIRAEDLSHLIALIDDHWFETAAEVRPFSTVLRRLLTGSGDLHKAAKLMRWDIPFRVSARMLDYENPNGQVIACAGGWRWGGDTLPDSSAIFGGEGIQPPPKEWTHRDGLRLPLTRYLESLSFAITGTKVRRRDVISYVANKKAAHTDENRSSKAHEALDDVWHSLYLTRVGDDGSQDTMNAVYLELLSILYAVAESTEIRAFVAHLNSCLSQASRVYDPKVSKIQAVTVSMPKVV